MKILGLEISLGKKTEDAINVSVVRPGQIPVSRIPTVKVAPLVYAQQFARVNRGVFFLAPEYDLAEIGKIEDTESLVRQAFKKKEGLMFKEGVSARGKNKDTIQYYKTRMAQIAQASGIPTMSLMKRVARSLIRCSNAYLVKVRSSKASGGMPRTTADGKNLQPVAAYFPAAPEMFKMDLDPESGKIRHWRQQLPNGWYKLFKPEDVVHFTLDKREGFSYGVPFLVPVIDDIRALRQIEENIELLIYQHLFPLFHYKVGTELKPAGYTEDGKREIEVIRDEVRMMPAEGMLVTDERAEISAIGSEGRAMNAEGYLNYFKKRVYMGLGMSSVDFGEADTSNRATANVVSRALVDAVKSIQDEFEAQWDQHIIRELLLESTFGEMVLEEENMVHLQFAEIDLQNKIETEKHAAEMFKANGLTWDEFRGELGLEPVPVPDNPEDQDNYQQYPEWFNTYWKLFEEPTNLIRAVDEPYSMAAQAAVSARTVSMTSGQQGAAQKSQVSAEKEIAKAKAAGRPSKATGVKPKKDSFEDHYVEETFSSLERETQNRIYSDARNRNRIDDKYLMTMARAWAEDSAIRLTSYAMARMVQGVSDQMGGMRYDLDNYLSSGRKKVSDRISKTLDRMARDVVSLTKYRIEKKLGDGSLSERIDSVIDELHIAFDAIRYRTGFLTDVELRKAYNFGRLIGMQLTGTHGFELLAHEDSCEQCKSNHGRIVIAEDADIDDCPPFHPGSRMEIRVIHQGPVSFQHQDSVQDDTLKAIGSREEGKPAVAQEDPAAEKNSAVCPKCGHTALYQPRSGNFYCSRCRESFRKVKDDLNVGGAGTVPTRQPSKPPVEKTFKALSPGKKPCPRCGFSVQAKGEKYKCSRCGYPFSDKENPKKIASGKPISPMPPKKRKEEAELPSGTGGPGKDATIEKDDILEDGAKLESVATNHETGQKSLTPSKVD